MLDAAQALASPGVRRHHHLEAPLPGIELPAAAVATDRDVVAEVVLEARGDTVVAEVTATAAWAGECRRCLTPTSGALEVELQEIYEDDPVEGETYPLVDQIVDLTPMLREALALALPLAPLCAEDCAGPAPELHPVGRSGDDGGDEDDPPDGGADRWAALDQLRLEDGG